MLLVSRTVEGRFSCLYIVGYIPADNCDEYYNSLSMLSTIGVVRTTTKQTDKKIGAYKLKDAISLFAID